MAAPFFYIADSPIVNQSLVLDEENSRHVVSVLRMEEGEALQLTDGKGNLYQARLDHAHKKKASVVIESSTFQEKALHRRGVAVGLLKQSARFEWFLEKATEMGITDIIPLITDRTERQHFRKDRMMGVLVSALIQSQQVWLPELLDPIELEAFPWEHWSQASISIAHCEERVKIPFTEQVQKTTGDKIILIGPEGDFSPEEIQTAVSKGATEVSLGETRLRTETAAMVAAALLVQIH